MARVYPGCYQLEVTGGGVTVTRRTYLLRLAASRRPGSCDGSGAFSCTATYIIGGVEKRS